MAKAKVKPKSKDKSKAPTKKPAAKKSAAKKSVKKAAAKKAGAKKPPGKNAVGKKRPPTPVKTAVAKKKGDKKSGSMKPPSKKPASKSVNVAWAEFFSPVGNRVLIEREEAATKTAGGLFIPDFVQERPNHARVLAAGPGSRSKKGRLQPLDVQVGDHVLFSAYAGSPIRLQGYDLLLIKEDEIQAILPQ